MGVIWQVCWPVLLYGLIIDGASALWGGGILECTALGAAFGVLIFGFLYKGLTGDGFGRKKDFGLKDTGFCAVVGIGAWAAVNTLIMISPLPRYFTGFSSAAEEIYGPPVFIQLAAVGVIIPAAEELVFRGMVFLRLRKRYSFAVSAWVSAGVFGLYHGNLLQGIYGFVMGWILAWAMERKGTIKAAMAIHMAANIASVVLTEAGYLFTR